jgi:DnaJ family protein B protein 6
MNSDYDFDFYSFQFRSPEEVFREFFRGDPFADIFGSNIFGGRSHHTSNNRGSRENGFGHDHARSVQNMFSPFSLGMSLDLAGFGHDDGFGGWGGSGGGGSNVKKTSTSTRFVNGKKITTKK